MATLKGQTVLVIGGSSGVGFGVALASLQSGASKVIIASSSQSKLDDAVQRLLSHPSLSEENRDFKGPLGQVESRVLDGKNLENVKRVVGGVGAIDHLVFSSGDQLRIVDIHDADVGKMKGGLSPNIIALLILMVSSEALDVRYWAAIQAAQSAKIKQGGSITFAGGLVDLTHARSARLTFTLQALAPSNHPRRAGLSSVVALVHWKPPQSLSLSI